MNIDKFLIRYTIGALFSPDLDKILLIKKNKPKWQQGKYNMPGGKFEQKESAHQCVSREFKEETDVFISPDYWHHIGCISGKDYEVDLLTHRLQDSRNLIIKKMTDEEPMWYPIEAVTPNNGSLISNIPWLTNFAINYWQQGNADGLSFGMFQYK